MKYRLVLDLEVADSARSPGDTDRRALVIGRRTTDYARRLRHVTGAAGRIEVDNGLALTVPGGAPNADNSGFYRLSATSTGEPQGAPEGSS